MLGHLIKYLALKSFVVWLVERILGSKNVMRLKLSTFWVENILFSNLLNLSETY